MPNLGIAVMGKTIGRLCLITHVDFLMGNACGALDDLKSRSFFLNFPKLKNKPANSTDLRAYFLFYLPRLGRYTLCISVLKKSLFCHLSYALKIHKCSETVPQNHLANHCGEEKTLKKEISCSDECQVSAVKRLKEILKH